MKILVVEDTEDSRVMLEMALTAEGYEVISGKNGVEALALAKTTSPDLIISDIMMPEMDGFELCRQIKNNTELNKIPFIIYTATYTERQDEELALALGASKFLVKPIEPKFLMEIIREELNSLQTSNVPATSKSLGEFQEIELEKMQLSSVSRKLDKKIEELEKERESLKISEEKYRKLVESVQNYYFFYTRNINSIFTYISPSIEIILGYKPDDFLSHYSDYLTDNPTNVEAEQRSNLGVSGKEQAPYEIEIYHKDGSIHWLEIKEVPIFNHKGTVSHIEGIAHDITERKQTEEILRRNQKMDALDKLTGGIVHDYNNTLAIILGYSKLLEESLNEQPKLFEYAHAINHAAMRGNKLSKKLLAFTRHKPADAKALDINKLLQANKNILEKSLTARIQLEFNLAENLWMVWLDSSDLEDAILNICLNAMHAMKTSGQLSIKTANQTINKHDTSPLNLSLGDYVLLSFTDTGCGIDDLTKEKIFDPFFTTKDENGTGLGLSQVYGFIERSKGRIDVYSELGHGTCLNLYFPRYTGENIEDIKTDTEHSVDLNANESILVVDDEPALLNLTNEILSRQGFKVYCAQSAKQALELLKHEPIDLMISDIIMPIMDGYELSTIVQNKYPHIKILLVSGFSDNGNKNIIDNALHQNLLHKPYSSHALLEKIRKLLV